MKLGIHLSTFTPSWEDDPLVYMETAAAIGYRAVEIPLMFPSDFDHKRAARLLSGYGLSCTCGTGMNRLEDVSSPDREIRNAGIRRLKRCAEIAAYLGSDCLGGVLYAPWGEKGSRKEAADRYRYSSESLFEAAEFAGGKGVTLSLELLNRYESFFLNTVEEGLAFLEGIKSPWIKLHFDTFHAHIEEKNLRESILLGGNHIYHVHLCDNNRAAPGSGSIDFPTVLETLHRMGYDRNLMVENFVIPDCPAGEETCIWSRRFETPFEDAKAAFHYISGLLEKGDYGNVETSSGL